MKEEQLSTPEIQDKVRGHLLLNYNLAYPNLIILLRESTVQQKRNMEPILGRNISSVLAYEI